MKYTYLQKTGDTLYVLMSEIEMPEKLGYGFIPTNEIIEINKIKHKKAYDSWLSSCKRIEVHPSEVEKVVKHFAKSTGCSVYNHFERMLMAGILIPSGALRVISVQSNHVVGMSETGLNHYCDEKEYAFLNEETKETFEEKLVREMHEKSDSEPQERMSKDIEAHLKHLNDRELKSVDLFSKYATESKEESQAELLREFLDIANSNILPPAVKWERLMEKFLITRRENK